MPGRRGAIADSIQALTAQLRADLARVWDRIAASVAALEADWPGMGPAGRRAALLALQAHIAALADAADEIAARHVLAGVRDAYLLGGHATALTVGAAALSSTGVDLEAITVLAGDTHADLLAATTHIRTSTKDLIRTLARDHVADRLYTGQTAVQAGRELARALAAKSVSAIVYKDGSRHGLAEYSQMVLRTKTAEAYQIGGFNQAAGFKVKYVEVMDGPNCVAEGTAVLPYGRLTAAVRASFSGPLYTITARTGSNTHSLTVGPNHPVLTARGWVRAHLLQEGDQLVYDTRLQDPSTLAELDLEQVPAVEDSFAAHVVALGSRSRPRLRHQLHGDAVFGQGEVEVVLIERGLLLEGDTKPGEHPGEHDLVGANAGDEPLTGNRQSETLLASVSGTPDRVMGGLGPSSPFLGRCPGVPASQRLTSPQGVATVLQRGIDHLGLDSQTFGDLPGREALVDVQPDHLVDGNTPDSNMRAGVGAEPPGRVVVRMEADPADFAGHGSAASTVELAHGFVLSPVVLIVTQTTDSVAVYDLSTTSGAFSANGFVVKNCGWTSHDDTQLANGLILTLDAARAYPIAHPNCRRVTMARPDLKSLDGAAPIGPQFTPAQLADAAKGGDVAFPRMARRANGTLAPVAAIATGPAAKRVAALQSGTGPAAARVARLQAKIPAPAPAAEAWKSHSREEILASSDGTKIGNRVAARTTALYTRGNTSVHLEVPMDQAQTAGLLADVAKVRAKTAGQLGAVPVRFVVPGGQTMSAYAGGHGELSAYVIKGDTSVYVNPRVADGSRNDASTSPRGFFMPAARTVPYREYTLTHELGHVLDTVREDTAQGLGKIAPSGALWHATQPKPEASRFHLANRNTVGSSDYGFSSAGEGYAEAFAQWVQGPGSAVADAYAKQYGWTR